MSQPLALNCSLRLQLLERKDYLCFVDYVNYSRMFAVRNSTFKEHVFSGSTWEVSVREVFGISHHALNRTQQGFPSHKDEWLLSVKSGTIASCGFVKHKFSSSCLIPRCLIESFFSGLTGFSSHFHHFLMECDNVNVAQMNAIDLELQLIAQQGNNSPHEEYTVDLYQCTKFVYQPELSTVECGLQNTFERSALDFPFSLVTRKRILEPMDVTYWIILSCDPWDDPEEVMLKLKKSLTDLGINICLCIVEQDEDIKCKRDVKFRLLSRNSYNTVLENAKVLFMGLGDDSVQPRTVEHKDFYFDTQQKFLSTFRSSIRLREIKEAGLLPKYTINFQEDISVDLGQQNRDFQSFSISDPSTAERIVQSKKLDLDDLGKNGKKLKEKIFPHGMRSIALDLKASFHTTRTIFPWVTFPTFFVEPHPSQLMSTDNKTLMINVDHTQYAIDNTAGGMRTISIYEVEVTKINECFMEVSSLEVKKALVEILQLMDVEFQASVMNKRKEHDCLMERGALR